MVRSKGETWEGATALQELLREQVILILTLVFESLHLGYTSFFGEEVGQLLDKFVQQCKMYKGAKKVRKYQPNKYLNKKPNKQL